MHLLVLGLNHNTAPVEVRERFSLSRGQITDSLGQLTDNPEIDEAVIISTCNRTEIYTVVNNGKAGLAAVQEFFRQINSQTDDIMPYFYWFWEGDCAEHLLRVAASLDSLVVGEGQILSQVKEAYHLAHKAGTAGTVLNLLFHRAITVGKRVRTETKIAYNPVSVSSAAVALAADRLPLAGAEVLIFGAGKMAELTARHFQSHNVRQLLVANRHYKRAEQFAAEFGGIAVSLREVFQRSETADVVVTSTGAPHYVIYSNDIRKLMVKRNGKPLFIIDIAVPRDVEPAVAEIEGVTLYNIDDLAEIVDEHKQQRSEEAKLAGTIVYSELEDFLGKLKYLSCRPLMLQLSERAKKIQEREVRRAINKLPELTEEERRVLNGLARMITRKLLREPMRGMAAAAGTKQEAEFAAAMRQVFHLRSEDNEETED